MKIDVPEHVAEAAIKALREGGPVSFEPNVVQLGQLLGDGLRRRKSSRLTGEEIEAMELALKEWVRVESDLDKFGLACLDNTAIVSLVRSAIVKIHAMLQTERGREAVAARRTP